MFLCKSCWNESIKRQGQCGFCKEWNCLKEFSDNQFQWDSNVKIKWEKKELKNIKDFGDNKTVSKIISNSSEFNNVLGGWIVPGGVVLLSWEPWIGKSTLSLQIANFVKEKVVYISWEETPNQIYERSKRLWIVWDNLKILWENCIENIFESLKDCKSDILIIDSISVMNSNNISWVSWSISQIKYIAELLISYAKTTNTSVFIIGHINKDWNLAWPKTLEHMVDTVLYFEWDKFDNLRILRWLKNRFGSTWEIWIFNMWEKWLIDVKNPWFDFVNSTDPTIGSSLSITLEWTRPIIIETESLTTYTKFGYPKKSARWINSSKLDLIIAVISKYTDIKLDSYDIYTNIARWLKIDEPWIDLSLATSIISSKMNKIIPKNIIFIWEISLTGKIKKPMNMEKRIKEAEKMWFKTVIIPETKITSKKIEIIKIKDIKDLIKIIQ